MISSIFGKTKPINFILIGGFLFFCVVWTTIHKQAPANYTETIFIALLLFCALFFSVLAADFIAKRNKLSKQNHYVIFIYGILVGVFPQVLNNIWLVFSQILILLALRKIISIQSLRDIKLKIFDAAFWIAFAFFCFEWTILYFIVLYLVIFKYVSKDFKNWLVPLVSFLTVSVLVLCYALLLKDVNWFTNLFMLNASFVITVNKLPTNWVPIVAILAITVVAVAHYFLKQKRKKTIKHGSKTIVFQTLIISVAVIGLSNNIQEALIFAFFPLAVIIGNYVQNLSKKWLKEVVLLSLLSLSVVIQLLI